VNKSKSVIEAYMWSIGATAIPIYIGEVIEPAEVGFFISAGGMAFGPSSGHFYARKWARGSLFTALRCVFMYTFLSSVCIIGGEQNQTLIYSSIICYIGTTVIDLCLIPNSVAKYNKAISNRKDKKGLNIVPRIDGDSKQCRIYIKYGF